MKVKREREKKKASLLMAMIVSCDRTPYTCHCSMDHHHIVSPGKARLRSALSVHHCVEIQKASRHDQSARAFDFP